MKILADSHGALFYRICQGRLRGLDDHISTRVFHADHFAEESIRRITELLEQDKVVCLETIQPEFAVWLRSCYPWPLSWICRKRIERELKKPFDGIQS